MSTGSPSPLPYPTSFATQELWQWRNDPPEFTIAVASCFYVNEPAFDRPGEPYGSDFQILEHLRARQPDAMVWLGDNTYLREADWHSRSGILHRYTHTRSYPGLQPLLASTHHYATWDDHDFGPNNSDRSYWAQGLTREAFELFWPNPSHGVQGVPGIATAFEWADTLFVLLDDRTNRTPNDRVTGKRTMLGDAQVEWLIDTLVSSTATLKFVAVGGQFLNPVDGFETFATFPEERERILQLLEAERVGGVFFLTGDRHRTELSKLDRRGLYPLYDLTVSPLTAGVYRGQTEVNTLRVDGTLLQDHNFALLHVAGPRTDRVLTITLGGPGRHRSMEPGDPGPRPVSVIRAADAIKRRCGATPVVSCASPPATPLCPSGSVGRVRVVCCGTRTSTRPPTSSCFPPNLPVTPSQVSTPQQGRPCPSPVPPRRSIAFWASSPRSGPARVSAPCCWRRPSFWFWPPITPSSR